MFYAEGDRMCGIGGYIKYSGVLKDRDVEVIRKMCELMEKRGKDAFGFITINTEGDVTRLFKLPVKATIVWEQLENELKEWMVGQKGVLFHTRAVTRGLASNNKNNHPFELKGIYLAHNGVAGRKKTYVEKKVYNGAVYQVYRYTYSYDVPKGEPETDSYQSFLKPLVSRLDSGMTMTDAIKRTIEKNNVEGAAWIYDENKGELWLVAGNDLKRSITISDDANTLMFMSEGFNDVLVNEILCYKIGRW